MFRALSLIVGLFMASISVNAAEIMQNGKKMTVPVCGGFPGLQCGPKEWCDYSKVSTCGIADQFGTCRPRPDICVEYKLEVCGCDGKNYDNACKAARDGGVSVAHIGPCGAAVR